MRNAALIPKEHRMDSYLRKQLEISDIFLAETTDDPPHIRRFRIANTYLHASITAKTCSQRRMYNRLSKLALEMWGKK